MMAAHGLHYPGDYEVKDTGGVPPRHKALLEGSIDAGLQSIPWNYVAEEAGFKDFGEVSKYVPDWQFVTVNANNDWKRHVGASERRLLNDLLNPPVLADTTAEEDLLPVVREYNRVA